MNDYTKKVTVVSGIPIKNYNPYTKTSGTSDYEARQLLSKVKPYNKPIGRKIYKKGMAPVEKVRKAPIPKKVKKVVLIKDDEKSITDMRLYVKQKLGREKHLPDHMIKALYSQLQAL